MKFFLRLFLLWTLLFSTAYAADDIVNVYSWANYISSDLLDQFTRETGIHVNYSTFDGNDTLYAKLKANPNIGYDVIVPSSYFVDRMRREHMLRKIDKSQLPNIVHLNKDLLNKPFDPKNDYSLPYFWGTTGIVVNKKYFNPADVQSWSDLWKPEFKNQIMMLDDTHDVFSMGLMVLGYPASDANPQHIYQAYLKLKTLMPNVKLFNVQAVKVNYIDEDATIGMAYSGDAYSASLENPDLVYIFPKDGFVEWIDCMAIPKYAPHVANAYKFMNFIMRPDIAAKLSEEMGYSSPNVDATKLLPKKLRSNYIVYPSEETLKRAQFEEDPKGANKLYEKYMEYLKIGA